MILRYVTVGMALITAWPSNRPLAAAEPPGAGFRQTVNSFAGSFIRGGETVPETLSYLLYVPEHYGRGESPWPLVLFLHGLGERGDNTRSVAKHGPPMLVERGMEYPFILVSPQCPMDRDQRWYVEGYTSLLYDLLREMISTYDIDRDRIYLTGLSMGGGGAWKLATEHPEMFAAVVPVCGAQNEPEQAWRLAKLPIWAFHGEADATVPISRTDRMVEALRTAGADVRYTVYPGVGHASWVPAYTETGLYPWLLSKRRPQDARPDSTGKGTYQYVIGATMENTIQYYRDKIPEVIEYELRLRNSADAPVSLSGSIPGGTPGRFGMTVEPDAVMTWSVALRPGEFAGEDGHFSFPLAWTAAYEPAGRKALKFEKQGALYLVPGYVCAKAPKKVAVDGGLSEWMPLAIAMDEPGQIRGNPDAFTGKEDCSLSFSVAHDARYLYIAVQVVDDDPYYASGKEPWQQDGIEFRIDPRKEPERALGRNHQDMLFVGLCPAPTPEDKMTIVTSGIAPDSMKYACTAVAGGFTAEIAVPLSFLTRYQGKRWTGFRLNVTADDYNDGDGNQVCWQPAWRTPANRPGSGMFFRGRR